MKKILIIATLLIVTAFATTVTAEQYAFTNDLSVGASGQEVSMLQTWLIDNGFDIPAVKSGVAAKGYFGTQTREALRLFQVSEGLPATGYFGPLSRGKVHNRGGNRDTDPRSPVINGVDAPTVLNIGETGTWTIRATDPQNGILSYSIDWGETMEFPVPKCPAGYTCRAIVDAPSVPTIQQGSTFTHSYKEARTYKVTFIVRNNIGLSAQSTATVKVVGQNASPLNIISPNGGEVWTKGSTQNIRWNAPVYYRSTMADVRLEPYYPTCNGEFCPMAAQRSDIQMPAVFPYITYMVVQNININQNSYTWNVGNVVTPDGVACTGSCGPNILVPDGQYTIKICETGTNNCDTSDKPFTIQSNIIPQVTSPNGGETWQARSNQYLRWSMPSGVNSMTRLDLYLDSDIVCPTVTSPGLSYQCPPTRTYTLDKNIPLTMLYYWIVATDINDVLIPTGSYRFRICTAGSTTECDRSDAAFTITQAQ